MEPSTNPDRPDPVKPDAPVDRTTPPTADGVPPTVNGAAAPPPTEGETAPPPPLTPMAWLINNGIYVIAFAAFIVWLYQGWGMMGILNAALALLGVSFVIFIHELGHFLAAKWCDVHVQTFSIGFGPAIPGCSFKRGETTYKVGILPLGGYVAMVGEGPEADENEDYPRSFKNKSVAARMLIISAGVIMNVILGFICFIIVYNHGREVPTAGVWNVDPGSPAWVKNVPAGSRIKRIGNTNNPTFVDLKNAVALSGYGEEIEFVFVTPDGKEQTIKLKPRRDANDMAPVIGVSPPQRLRLMPKSAARWHDIPVLHDSAAAAARPVELHPGDVVTAATNPDRPDEMKPVAGLEELCERMRLLTGKPLKVQVLRKGQPEGGPSETLDVPVLGFDFGDNIIGTSDPETADPFVVKPLPPEPGQTDSKSFHGDSHEFRRRMRLLAGKTAVIEVRRAGGETVQLLVPPAFHRQFGLRMQMGSVAAVREGSPAEAAGIQPLSSSDEAGDVLAQVKMVFANGQSQTWKNEEPGPNDRILDPMRLPYEMAAAARAHPGKVLVTLGVKRRIQHRDQLIELEPVEWDASRDNSSEKPASWASPLSIPQLGLAYFVRSQVAAVYGDFEKRAEGFGDTDLIQPNDQIEQIRTKYLTRNPHTSQMEERWGNWVELKSKRGDKTEVFDEWPYAFEVLQEVEVPIFQVRIRRGEKLLDGAVEITPGLDRTWPLADRGLILEPEFTLEKGENLWQSLGLGLKETNRWLVNMYLQLRSLLTGRISAKALGGPLQIASQAFYFADDIYVLIMFMGILSINLAVLNFLPIPILDGGHMVFLIYEGIRGKPPSETVKAVAMYIGLALLLALMIFVCYQDIMRLFFGAR